MTKIARIPMIQTKPMTWLLIRIIAIIRSDRKYPAIMISRGQNRGIAITSFGLICWGFWSCERVGAVLKMQAISGRISS